MGRTTIASSAPRLEIEKRLSVIDNYTNQMNHHMKNARRVTHSSSPGSTTKSDTDPNIHDETDDLINITNKLHQKENENVRHQIRKVQEQQNIEQSNIEQLRQDFLKLAPSRTQKPRIDAAYEKQNLKIKEKITTLDRKKQTLEGKLSTNRNASNEQLTKFAQNENIAPNCPLGFNDSSLNQNSRNNSGSGITWGDQDEQLSLASESIHSLSKNKSNSYHSLEERSNHSPKSDHISKDSFLEAAIMEQKEYIDERMRECEDKMDQTGREINEVYSKIEKNQNHSKEEMDIVLDKIMKISEEFNTSFELRAAEIRSLRNDFDEQLNMVRYGSKARHDELSDKLEILGQKLDDIETKQRYRLIQEEGKKSESAKIIPEKSIQALIDILLHAAGIVLLTITSLKTILSPLTRSWARMAASISIVIISTITVRLIKAYSLPVSGIE